MQPDSTKALFSGIENLLTDLNAIAGILGAIVAIIGFKGLLPYLRIRRDRRSLEKRFGAELYPKGVIENSTRHYIDPDCQSLDPAGAEEPRGIVGTRQNLFATIDEALNHPTEHKYIILLADSGMGKTSFFLNYYARHLRKRGRKFDLALVPLGIPDADNHIQKIPNKQKTVLFLDALDEDTLAIVDHVERLRNLLALTRDFERVVISCRTQFFPKDEEIPRETGIVKVGPRAAGESAQYAFHKLYLSPFTDAQVAAYLKRRYPFRQKRKREKALAMAKKIPQLSIRPMLLSHIDDLVQTGREIKYAFELYEEMVEAWLMREEGIVEGSKGKKEALRQFSERLAVDLYVNFKQRRAERIPAGELTALAKAWRIPLDDWQLTGRSLLNRDAVGNYKFAHRSIMEYLFVKRLVDGDELCRGQRLTDQMVFFLIDKLRHQWQTDRRISIDLHGLDLANIFRTPIKPIFDFRTEGKKLSENDVKNMCKEIGFFDSSWNKDGRGIFHLFEIRQIEKEKSVLDFATGLMWQQSGSPKTLTFKDAKKYIQQLNNKKFAGFSDWRLPTLEEAMSLMECEKNNDGLYIDAMFDKTKRWIWTADKSSAELVWVVVFGYGRCSADGRVDYGVYVRAVRS